LGKEAKHCLLSTPAEAAKVEEAATPAEAAKVEEAATPAEAAKVEEAATPAEAAKVEEAAEEITIESIPILLKELDQKSAEDQNKIIRQIFELLKNKCSELKGTQISDLLMQLKDVILENIGSSLALFDITKQARELKNLDILLTPSKVNYLIERIDNWVKRIIK